jgi:hypothetical protein
MDSWAHSTPLDEWIPKLSKCREPFLWKKKVRVLEMEGSNIPLQKPSKYRKENRKKARNLLNLLQTGPKGAGWERWGHEMLGT